VAKSYPNFRRVQREGGPFGRPARREVARAGFGGLVLAAMVVGGAVSWQITPQLLSLWRSVGAPPEQIARAEQSVYYAGCGDARAAGAAPIYRGAPGYRAGLDADDDGVACEPQRTP
jgi:hypothetical protein